MGMLLSPWGAPCGLCHSLFKKSTATRFSSRAIVNWLESRQKEELLRKRANILQGPDFNHHLVPLQTVKNDVWGKWPCNQIRTEVISGKQIYKLSFDNSRIDPSASSTGDRHVYHHQWLYGGISSSREVDAVSVTSQCEGPSPKSCLKPNCQCHILTLHQA